MKIDLAVYTAQSGYGWQPGTRIGIDDIVAYKGRIGKFPSADEDQLPFGGILFHGGMVVFYRFHVAKKIDFCGRDAIYCVLGRVPKAEAALVDPKALFALPEFAGPTRAPFPVEAELPECGAELVPSWLKELDRTVSLNVRVSGTVEALKYEVKQELERPPSEEPPKPAEPVQAANPPPPVAGGGAKPAAAENPKAEPASAAGPVQGAAPGPGMKGKTGKLWSTIRGVWARPKVRWICLAGLGALLLAVVAVAAVLYSRLSQTDKTGQAAGQPATVETNRVESVEAGDTASQPTTEATNAVKSANTEEPVSQPPDKPAANEANSDKPATTEAKPAKTAPPASQPAKPATTEAKPAKAAPPASQPAKPAASEAKSAKKAPPVSQSAKGTATKAGPVKAGSSGKQPAKGAASKAGPAKAGGSGKQPVKGTPNKAKSANAGH